MIALAGTEKLAIATDKPNQISNYVTLTPSNIKYIFHQNQRYAYHRSKSISDTKIQKASVNTSMLSVGAVFYQYLSTGQRDKLSKAA